MISEKKEHSLSDVTLFSDIIIGKNKVSPTDVFIISEDFSVRLTFD